MLLALVVMAGVLLLTVVVNSRRQPSRWDGAGSGWDNGNTGNGSAWAFGDESGGDSGGQCGMITGVVIRGASKRIPAVSAAGAPCRLRPIVATSDRPLCGR